MDTSSTDAMLLALGQAAGPRSDDAVELLRAEFRRLREKNDDLRRRLFEIRLLAGGEA